MTTPEAARLYEAQHAYAHAGKGWAVYNPENLPVEQLPTIYGFNNGGDPGWYSAELLAEDGTGLGGHICSAESYMPHDLGILEGTKPDRHESFKAHYPKGYKMEFVKGVDVREHAGITAACLKNQEKTKDASPV